MSNMTVAQLKKACESHKYLLLRLSNYNQIAVNTKVSKIALKKKHYADNAETGVISFIPCDFITYIHYKTPFL